MNALRFLSLASLAAACSAVSPGAPSADEAARWRVGVGVEAYPAGVIGTVTGRRALDEHAELVLRAGYNSTDRRDFGEHDDEEGGGAGVGVGWRTYRELERTGFWYGARVDVWDLEIDWEDDPATEGTTDVLVVQPALELGWAFRTGERSRLELGAAVGAEINVDTDGEDVGEGAIGLVGLSWVWGL